MSPPKSHLRLTGDDWRLIHSVNRVPVLRQIITIGQINIAIGKTLVIRTEHLRDANPRLIGRVIAQSSTAARSI